ncbi:hypothetical protein [Streptomyces sp. NPDC054874]
MFAITYAARLPDQGVPAVGGGFAARPVRAQQVLQAGAVLHGERLKALGVPGVFLGAHRAERGVRERPVRPVTLLSRGGGRLLRGALRRVSRGGLVLHGVEGEGVGGRKAAAGGGGVVGDAQQVPGDVADPFVPAVLEPGLAPVRGGALGDRG